MAHEAYPEEYYEEELGLDKKQARGKDEHRKKQAGALEEEWRKESLVHPKRYFFIFENNEIRDNAVKAIEEAKDYDELLLQLDGGGREDPKRPMNGLQLNFKYGRAGLRQNLKDFFASRKFKIIEDYAPDDAPEDLAVERPARGDSSELKKAA